MKNTIPHRINPYRASDQHLCFSGLLPATDMQRLISMNVTAIDDPKVELRFMRDEGGVAVLRGSVSLTIEFHCQRCLKPYHQSIHAPFVLGVVNDLSKADALPKSYEPVFTVDRELIISDLIEDEVLLALPIIPKHPLDQCDVNQSVTSDADSSFALHKNEQSHPFHALNVLKNKR